MRHILSRRIRTRKPASTGERPISAQRSFRSAEVLALDVEDLDLPSRRAKVRRKGAAVDIIVWQTGTARLLPRLLKGRASGPVFVTDRKARVQLPPPTWTGTAAPGCPTSTPRTCSSRPLAAPPSTSCATRRSRTTPKTGRRPRCSWPLRAYLGPVAGQVRPGLRRGAGAAPGRARPGPPPVRGLQGACPEKGCSPLKFGTAWHQLARSSLGPDVTGTGRIKAATATVPTKALRKRVITRFRRRFRAAEGSSSQP